jgi:hypothetical protein
MFLSVALSVILSSLCLAADPLPMAPRFEGVTAFPARVML